MRARRDAANSTTSVTTDLGGAFTTDFTYDSPGTYIASVSFLGSPTADGITGPGAGGVPGAYLLPCGPHGQDIGSGLGLGSGTGPTIQPLH